MYCLLYSTVYNIVFSCIYITELLYIIISITFSCRDDSKTIERIFTDAQIQVVIRKVVVKYTPYMRKYKFVAYMSYVGVSIALFKLTQQLGSSAMAEV